MPSTDDLRDDAQKLRRRRLELFKEIRDFERDRRDLLEQVHRLKDRDPNTEQRAAMLERKLRKALEEINEIEAKLPDRRKRRQRVTRRLAKVRKALKEQRKSGGDAAVRWALDQVGKTESPYGSNWGEPIQSWIQNCGYTSPVPWCGCFAREAAVDHGGADIPADYRMGYAGYIADDARTGSNGFQAVSFDDARPGDVLVFWGTAHIGLCVEAPSGDSIQTVEGNTSSGTSGSQSNGGGVYRRTRSRSDVTVVARPDYP